LKRTLWSISTNKFCGLDKALLSIRGRLGFLPKLQGQNRQRRISFMDMPLYLRALKSGICTLLARAARLASRRANSSLIARHALLEHIHKFERGAGKSLQTLQC
jgi:hypothetical protein